MKFNFDVVDDDARRRIEWLKAQQDDWSPLDALTDELAAAKLLYSNLDAQQQRIYDQLVDANVLTRLDHAD